MSREKASVPALHVLIGIGWFALAAWNLLARDERVLAAMFAALGTAYLARWLIGSRRDERMRDS